MAELTTGKAGFQKWLASKESTALLDAWNTTLLTGVATSAEAFEASRRAHFGSYPLPADCSGWLLGLAMLSETLPLSLTVSDCGIAGFPLVYVNQKFIEVTGYDKRDCEGRNCRFLQGPGTNPEHGQHLLDTLRDGKDSQTMLLNYRKSGEPFENLLTMRFVHDSLGRRRFCIGFQLDLTGMESDPGPWGARALASGAGKALMADARLKMSKLIQMLPNAIPVQPPPPVKPFAPAAAWSDASLEALGGALGTGMPPTAGIGWLAALCALLDRSPHAAIVVDMSVPMVPIMYANSAFTSLTGYTAKEAIGRNCRFLQGGQTEGGALATVVRAVRERSVCTVRITNVRKDGSPFPNDLSLHPVHDSAGMYRFNIGVLSDASASAPASAVPLSTLRASMPARFDVSLQPPSPLPFAPCDALAQWKEFQPSTSKLMRLLWSTDPDGALRRLLTLPAVLARPAITSLGSFFASKLPEDEKRLATLVGLMQRGEWSVLAGRVDQQ